MASCQSTILSCPELSRCSVSCRAFLCQSGDSICSSSFDKSSQMASITLSFSSLERCFISYGVLHNLESFFLLKIIIHSGACQIVFISERLEMTCRRIKIHEKPSSLAYQSHKFQSVTYRWARSEIEAEQRFNTQKYHIPRRG